MVEKSDNPAHAIISRAEFVALLEAAPKWQGIIEQLRESAYQDLAIATLENNDGNGIVLSTLVGIRGHNYESMRLSHLNFLIESPKDVSESS